MTLYEEMIGLAGFVMFAVELVKPGLNNVADRFKWGDQAKAWLIQFISILIGVLAVFGGGPEMNLFSGSEIYGRYVFFGQLVTGALVGLGAKYIHATWQLIFRKPIPAPVLVTELTPTVGEVTVTQNADSTTVTAESSVSYGSPLNEPKPTKRGL